MIYPYNKQKPDILIDGTPDMRLANILAIMDRETFGQRKAASMVGGLGRLLKLIEEGKIGSDKPTNKQNGKWYFNAADVLKYAISNIVNLPKRRKMKIILNVLLLNLLALPCLLMFNDVDPETGKLNLWINVFGILYSVWFYRKILKGLAK